MRSKVEIINHLSDPSAYIQALLHSRTYRRRTKCPKSRMGKQQGICVSESTCPLSCCSLLTNGVAKQGIDNSGKACRKCSHCDVFFQVEKGSGVSVKRSHLYAVPVFWVTEGPQGRILKTQEHAGCSEWCTLTKSLRWDHRLEEARSRFRGGSVTAWQRSC